MNKYMIYLYMIIELWNLDLRTKIVRKIVRQIFIGRKPNKISTNKNVLKDLRMLLECMIDHDIRIISLYLWIIDCLCII